MQTHDHTSAQVQARDADHADRLSVYQLPSDSPELTPIEALWTKVKKGATRLRWFPYVTDLGTKGSTALTKPAGLPDELTALAGEYRQLTSPAA
jgi:hypothetical protein